MLQLPLSRQNSVAASHRYLAKKISLLAKQAKAAFHLPDDMKSTIAGGLRRRRVKRLKHGEYRQKDGKAHDSRLGWHYSSSMPLAGISRPKLRSTRICRPLRPNRQYELSDNIVRFASWHVTTHFLVRYSSHNPVRAQIQILTQFSC